MGTSIVGSIASPSSVASIRTLAGALTTYLGSRGSSRVACCFASARRSGVGAVSASSRHSRHADATRPSLV